MAPELQSRAPSIKEEHAMLAVDIFSLVVASLPTP